MTKENNVIELNNGFKEAKEYHAMLTAQEENRLKNQGCIVIISIIVLVFVLGVWLGAWTFGS